MHADRRLKLKTAEYAGQKQRSWGCLIANRAKFALRSFQTSSVRLFRNSILNQIEGGSTVYTDGWAGYDNLAARDYVHETVNHLEEYVRGKFHTQGIENFWSLLKRTFVEPTLLSSLFILTAMSPNRYFVLTTVPRKTTR